MYKHTTPTLAMIIAVDKPLSCSQTTACPMVTLLCPGMPWLVRWLEEREEKKGGREGRREEGREGGRKGGRESKREVKEGVCVCVCVCVTGVHYLTWLAHVD